MSVTENIDKNLARAVQGVGEAVRKGADIVCLPELFAWRYFPATRGSRQVPQPIPGKVSRTMSEAARKNKVVLVGGSIYEKAGASNYNTCLTFDEKGRTVSKPTGRCTYLKTSTTSSRTTSGPVAGIRWRGRRRGILALSSASTSGTPKLRG